MVVSGEGRAGVGTGDGVRGSLVGQRVVVVGTSVVEVNGREGVVGAFLPDPSTSTPPSGGGGRYVVMLAGDGRRLAVRVENVVEILESKEQSGRAVSSATFITPSSPLPPLSTTGLPTAASGSGTAAVSALRKRNKLASSPTA